MISLLPACCTRLSVHTAAIDTRSCSRSRHVVGRTVDDPHWCPSTSIRHCGRRVFEIARNEPLDAVIEKDAADVCRGLVPASLNRVF
jgi:hypothetical protein